MKANQNPLFDAAAGEFATSYQEGTAGWDATPAVFRETATSKETDQLCSDARLASATPPISWRDPLHGQKPLETDLPLQNTSADEARATAREPPANNQWLTPFESSNASGSLRLSFGSLGNSWVLLAHDSDTE